MPKSIWLRGVFVADLGWYNLWMLPIVGTLLIQPIILGSQCQPYLFSISLICDPCNSIPCKIGKELTGHGNIMERMWMECYQAPK